MEKESGPVADPAKVVILGSPGMGKTAMASVLGEVLGDGKPRTLSLCGGKAMCMEMTWSEPLLDGRPLPLRLHILGGQVDFGGVFHLMLQGCEGLLFLLDAHADHLSEAPALFKRLIENGHRAGIDFTAMPFALQYHRTEYCAGFRMAEMDRLLGIPPDEAIPRFATTSTGVDRETVGIEWVVRQIIAERGSKSSQES